MRAKRYLAATGLAVSSLLVTAIVPSAPAFAASSSNAKSSRWSDIQRKIRETRQRIREAKAKERGLIAQINASDLRRERLEDALAALGIELRGAATRLDVLETALGRTEIELDRRTEDLENTLAALDEQSKIMAARAAEKYMSGPMSFTPVLFNTADFRSFVAADQYVDSVLEADRKVLDHIRELRDEIESERALLGDRKAALGEQVATVQAERDRIATLRAREASARRKVIQEINYRKNLLSKVRDERQAYEEALASLQRESDSISGLLRGVQKGQKVLKGAGKGYLVWPVSGRISSGYGWRTHPIYKKRSFHTGIDIASPSGTTIGAARAGKVVYSGYKGAFGLVVLIDHGDSVATMYAHMSKATVSSGAKVGKGAPIGRVGCTGWCTGPHSHFEVRLAGEPTNPTRWL